MPGRRILLIAAATIGMLALTVQPAQALPTLWGPNYSPSNYIYIQGSNYDSTHVEALYGHISGIRANDCGEIWFYDEENRANLNTSFNICSSTGTASANVYSKYYGNGATWSGYIPKGHYICVNFHDDYQNRWFQAACHAM